MTTPERLNLWLVNQYALRIDQPGITRHATLAKYMYPDGVRTTIFASPTHYWNVADSQAISADLTAPAFRYVKTPAIESNGAKRVLSMLAFSVRTFAAAALSARSKSERPGVVLGSSPHPFAALSAWAIARRYRVPFVLEVRDLWPASLVQLMGVSTRHPLIVLLGLLERFLYRRAAAIITLLPGSERHINDVAGRPRNIVVIPNGVDLSRVPPVTPRQPSEEFVVMYAGAHGIPNSLDTILAAADILARRGDTTTRFVFIGGGKEKPALQRMAREKRLSQVEFRDAIPKDELLQRLPEADILVIIFRDTDLYRDGISPNKVFDYFAAGRPVVIGVRTPSNPVEAADAGVVIAPENAHALVDAITTLRAMPVAERNAMGRRGRDYVAANYDMATSARRLHEVLLSVVGRARDPK